MRFEWDGDKDFANRRKHDVDFDTASRIFSDPMLLLEKDRIVEGEQRWHGIGSVANGVILVVHVYREEYASGEEIIRIISARQTSAKERRGYFQQTANG